MADGFTFESLVASLSGLGSSSGTLIDLSITGAKSRVLPLVDYNDYSQHIFFGNALRRFLSVRKEIIDKYPIGLSGLSADSVLLNANVGPKAIFEVDKFRKEADGFTTYVLDRLGVTGSSSSNVNADANTTVLAVNENGENVPLIAVYRNAANSITGSQTGMIESLSARAVLYEDEERNVIDQTAGTGTEIIGTSTGAFRSEIHYPATASEQITRAEKLENLLPEALFSGDTQDVLKRLLAGFGDELDEIKSFANQIPYSKTIDYGKINRTPDKFIATFLRQFGVNVFENARRSSFEKSLVNSSSGGFTSQSINYEIQNRILNNVMHLLKTKGTRETLEAIGRIYGVDSNFLKTNEYSVFYRPKEIREIEEVDTPALFATGSTYVQTTAAVTGSARAFDVPANNNFTLQLRVSATGAALGSSGYTLFVHPLYRIEMNASGQVAFKSTVTSSLSAQTDLTSLSSFVRGGGSADNFLNVAVSRSGDTLSVYAMALSASPTGGNEIVIMDKAITSNGNGGSAISKANFDSSGGVGAAMSIGGASYSQFPSYFPGSGSTRFVGYIHQVRRWNVALKDEDLKQHTRNFESVSFQSSTGTDIVNSVDNRAYYGSLSAHYKLKENMVLTGDFNFIVDSTTASNTAIPVGFEAIPDKKRYRVFQNMKKVNRFFPVGFAADNDRIRQDDPSDDIRDTGYISFSMNPMNAVNRAIKNSVHNVSPSELLGDPEDLFAKNYEGAFKEEWHKITGQWGLATEIGITGDALINEVIKSGGGVLGSGVSGASGNTSSLVDLNTFVKAMGNFNDTFGGLFPFVQQFLPAKTNIIGEGIFIESPMFERNKMRRQFGFRESTSTGYVGAPTTSGNLGHISDDEGRETFNQTPSIIEHAVTGFTINNHFLGGDLSTAGSNSANDKTLIASAATTASFQGFKYRDGLQEFVDRSVTATRAIPNLTKESSTNVPRFSSTRIARVLPIRVKPSAGAVSVIDVTLDKVLISPTATPISSNVLSIIKGSARLLTKGRSFKTDQPGLRFEFPTSADGTNLFEATVGNISQGKGRLIKDKDSTFTTTLETPEIEFELQLADVVRALTAVNTSRAVSHNLVNETVSGSLGIVPIRIVNLFNNDTQIVRVAINSDSTKDQNLIREIENQGGEKVTS